MPVIRLSQTQAMSLVDADWRDPDGAVRLNRDLGRTDLRGSLIVNHASLVLAQLETGKGVRLTKSGNFNRKFVE